MAGDKFEIEITSTGKGDSGGTDSGGRSDRREATRDRAVRASAASKRAEVAGERAQTKFEQGQEDRKDRKERRNRREKQQSDDRLTRDNRRDNKEKTAERKAKETALRKEVVARRLADERSNRARIRNARNLTAEGNKAQTLRRRFINNAFGAFNHAHLGRRINHGIDFVRSLFSGGGGLAESKGSGGGGIKSFISNVFSPKAGQGGTGGVGGIGGRPGPTVNQTPSGLRFPSPRGVGGGAAAAGGGLAAFLGPAAGIAALTAVVAGSVAGFTILNRHIKNFAKTLEGIPSELTFAQLETSLMVFEKRLQRGQEFGRDLATIERLRGQRISAGMELNDTFTDTFMPLVIQGNRLLTSILTSLGKGFEDFFTVISPFIEFLSNQLSSTVDIGENISKFVIPLLPLISSIADIAENMNDRDREKDTNSRARGLFEFLQNPTVLNNRNAVVEFGFGEL